MTQRKSNRKSKATPPPQRFVDTLARVLEMAGQAEHDEQYRPVLRSELQSLSEPSRNRLVALVNLGREAHDRTHVRTSVALETAVPLDLLALCDSHTLAQRYLQRGLAAACAARLDLRSTTREETAATGNANVYERAWARFGRELAGSEPADWSWFACYKSRTRLLDKLYVKQGRNAWWSFSATLDRPMRQNVDSDFKRARNARLGQHGSSLESLTNQQSSPTRRALRRALTSVRARLGQVHVARMH